MRRPDVVVAAVALSACAVAYGLTYRFAVLPAALVSGLGAGVFPRLVDKQLEEWAVLAPAPLKNPQLLGNIAVELIARSVQIQAFRWWDRGWVE